MEVLAKTTQEEMKVLAQDHNFCGVCFSLACLSTGGSDLSCFLQIVAGSKVSMIYQFSSM
jgi:hypothetical protein